ncbi:DUF4058 family protein [soil metagenome]
MPSPFPGMDPFLEEPKRWPLFRHQFVAALYQIVLPGLVDRYRVRVATRDYTTELPLFTSVLREQQNEEYIEVRDRSDGRLVTLMDVVSPANRTTTTGREVYLETRKQAENQRVALVEIDLVTQGQPMLTYPRDNLPDFDYSVTVTRPAAPGKFEIYTATVQKRLPKFRMPLAGDDKDAMIELQDVFRRAYDLAGFASIIDYAKPLPADVQFAEATKEWVTSLLDKNKS